MKRVFLAFAFLGSLLSVSTYSLSAETLRVAISKAPKSLDPHKFNIGTDIAIHKLIYQTLITDTDDVQEFDVPGILEYARPLDTESSHWELKIREGVKFHDGSDLDAEDVAYSMKRMQRLPADGPAPFAQYVASIEHFDIQSNHVLHIKTTRGYNSLQGDFRKISIVPKPSKEGANEQFTDASEVIGTQPYRLVSYEPQKSLDLQRFEEAWTRKPYWENISLEFMDKPLERYKALINGDVDVAEKLPTKVIPELEALGFNVTKRITERVIYLQMDMQRDESPYVFDHSGEPLKRNPFKDIRVRQAISKAIDRERIIKIALNGGAQIASQLFIPTSPLHSSVLQAENHNIKEARKLLRDAGYPKGFQLTIHGPKGRYNSDVEILQMVASMLGEIGIKTTAVSLPVLEYFKTAYRNDHSLNLLGWIPSFEGGYTYNGLFATYSPDHSLGTYNAGRYSNPRLDAILRDTNSTQDEARKHRLFQLANEVVSRDLAYIPLHFQMGIWGLRKDLYYSQPVGHAFIRPDLVRKVQ